MCLWSRGDLMVFASTITRPTPINYYTIVISLSYSVSFSMFHTVSMQAGSLTCLISKSADKGSVSGLRTATSGLELEQAKG